MVLPGLFPGSQNGVFAIIQTLISLLFIGMIFFFPRIMLWQVDRKLKSALVELDTYRNDAEMMFLKELDTEKSKAFQRKFDSMKDFKFSVPTALDPAGMVRKLENVLDASEDKFQRFIEGNAATEDEEELANLNMAFKGVMGTNQIYKVIRHFRQLVSKTKTFQLIGIIQMMLPIYREIAESQRDATRAFVDQAPIGDSIGPLVAAKMIESEPEEIAEDIVHSEEEVSGQEVHVVKSKGPGARLGKYGDAIDSLAEENDLKAVITVDAAGKLEGEETGNVAEGVGVMMGGPGVEKSKIEEAAAEHDVPLEGILIKQAPPEASKPMKKEIYEAWNPAVEKAEEIVNEFDGPVAVVGVGNSVGIGNTRGATTGVSSKLQKYWKEYEEKEEKEVSYQGLMGAMPGGDSSALEEVSSRFLWRIPR
jgi:hypothetical protein